MEQTDSRTESINEFEKLVLARNYKAAEELIVKLIRLYGKDKISLTLGPFDRRLTPEQSDLESYQIIEKLAFSLTMWFSDPNWQPSPQIYSYLAMQKLFLGSIFAASSYHSMDHIAANLGLLGKANYTPEELKRIMLVFTIESAIELPWLQLLEHLPNETAQVFTGLVSTIGIQLSDRAKKNISYLLSSIAQFPTVKTQNAKNLGPILKAYFNCSNLADPNKYELKKWIVRSLEEFMSENLTPGLKKRIARDVKKSVSSDKQTLLLVHELYAKNHAMYRCWHNQVKLLKEHFHVITLGQEENVDSLGQEDGHEFIAVKDTFDIQTTLKAVLKVSPDIIVYSSLGMSVFAPFLATQRLAPLQIVLPGHPSSSYMPNIDYFYMPDIGISEEQVANILTEKWLKVSKDSTNMVPTNMPFIAQGNVKGAHIAINGVIQKVSNELIDVCKAITNNSNKLVHFHLFMSSPKQDVEYFSAASMLRRFLPNSTIHPFKSYNEYINVLNKCSFALPTFPFGGTNSNIDLINLAKPKLFLKLDGDVSENSDFHIWNDLGVLDGLCSSPQEIVTKALNWLENESELEQVISNIKEGKLAQQEESNTCQDDPRLVNAILGLIN